MVALVLFFIVIIGLILLLIPLLKKVLNDYALTLESRSEKFTEKKPNPLQQAMNQSVEQRWQELDELFTHLENPTSIQPNSVEILQSLSIYLQSILKIFKSEESST
ncbi:hypothetical protein MG290_12205 [Flavobacterium sp. CBA20B-1]|uniref:hypothetical protein n=1 Tax=unclassified Flavobacterium TaxID=196869 RepID=UPI0022247DCC|nr:MULTISPECIES: hypothetical protein [unclassified Flavobacterium]WCM41700.1 hypothetical protein MG290_12205 [Flavobacterium sp. CBA20B-1]